MSDWDPREVEDVLESFVAADPEDRASRLALADTYRRLFRPDEAERTLAELPSLDPDARVIRIRMAQERGDDRTIDSLLEAGPDDHAGLARFRGRRALGRRDIDAAIRYFRIVLDDEPTDRDTLYNLATALVLTGDVAEAKALKKTASDYDNLESLIEQVSQPSRHEDLAILRAGSGLRGLPSPARGATPGTGWRWLVIPSTPRSRRRCSASNRRADPARTRRRDS